MKNKKIIYGVLAITVLVILIIIVALKYKTNEKDSTPTEYKNLVEELTSKNAGKKYFKINELNFLTEDTSFSEYAFINNSSIYIYLILQN